MLSRSIVSSASEGSSSICSTNGLNGATKSLASWTTISGITDAHFLHALQNVVHNEEQLNANLIGDVITNDMIIINATDLDHSDNEMIANCNFDKTNGQTTIDSYFVDQETQQHQHHHHHLPDANDSILIESNLSNLSNAILNDSSNEVQNASLNSISLALSRVSLMVFNFKFIFIFILIFHRHLLGVVWISNRI